MQTVDREVNAVRQPIREILHLSVYQKNLGLLSEAFARQNFYILDVKIFFLWSHLVSQRQAVIEFEVKASLNYLQDHFSVIWLRGRPYYDLEVFGTLIQKSLQIGPKTNKNLKLLELQLAIHPRELFFESGGLENAVV